MASERSVIIAAIEQAFPGSIASFEPTSEGERLRVSAEHAVLLVDMPPHAGLSRSEWAQLFWTRAQTFMNRRPTT